MEGKGEYSIRDLLKNALPCDPTDRGRRVPGGEALDMLQAMNTGHDGSLTTTHANSRVSRSLAWNVVLMSGLDAHTRDSRADRGPSTYSCSSAPLRRQPQGDRHQRGHRLNDEGDIELVPTSSSSAPHHPKGKVEGEFRATGFLPTFLNTFLVMGL